MSHKVVILDVDGVLANFGVGFYQYAQVDPAHLSDKHTWEDWPGFTPRLISETWARITRSDKFWFDLPMLCTLVEARQIVELAGEHDVYFVSSRHGLEAKYQTERWLGYLFDLYNPTVILSNRKGEVAHAVQATHCIDDKAGNAVSVAYMSPGTASYILDQPYNQFDHQVMGSRVKRVKTLTDFIGDVRGEG